MADAIQMIDYHFCYFRYQLFIIIARGTCTPRLAFRTQFAFHGTPRSFRKRPGLVRSRRRYIQVVTVTADPSPRPRRQLSESYVEDG